MKGHGRGSLGFCPFSLFLFVSTSIVYVYSMTRQETKKESPPPEGSAAASDKANWAISYAASSGDDGFEDATEAHDKEEEEEEVSVSLVSHKYGKARVRVMKVMRERKRHEVYEYEVATTLYSSLYARAYTAGDNREMVATDTQKNTVYVVAKRTKSDCPEDFGVELCQHFLKEYSVLEAVEVKVIMTKWQRAVVGEEEHNHAFLRQSPETDVAHVRLDRSADNHPPHVESSLENVVWLKTTQSGFEGYLQDKYTLLPESRERILSTSMDCRWTYREKSRQDENYDAIDFGAVRHVLRDTLLEGIFGPPKDGEYSPSLQHTIYHAASKVLQAIPQVDSLEIETPNLHYLPLKTTLEKLGETFEEDVFIPTSEPSGVIHCKVARKNKSDSV